MRRFRRNKLAMVGLVFIVLLVLVAIFASLIAPYSFAELDTGANRAAAVVRATGSAPTRSAATCSPGSSTAPGSR